MSTGSVESHVWTRRLLGGVALIALAALGVVTWHALRIEASEARTRRAAAEQESLRLALWRMDSLMTPILAREAARPYFEYESFYPAGRAYSDVYLGKEISEGDVMLPSPLLSNDDPIVQMHFQQIEGKIESPQAPTGAKRDFAEGVYLSQYAATLKQSKLAELKGLLANAPVAQTSKPLYSSRKSNASNSEQYKKVPAESESNKLFADAIRDGLKDETTVDSPAQADDSSGHKAVSPTAPPNGLPRVMEPPGGKVQQAEPQSEAQSGATALPETITPASDAVVPAPRKESPLEQVQREDYQKRAALTKQAQTKGQTEANNITSRNARVTTGANVTNDADNRKDSGSSAMQGESTSSGADASREKRVASDDEKNKSAQSQSETKTASPQPQPAASPSQDAVQPATQSTQAPVKLEELAKPKSDTHYDQENTQPDPMSLPSEMGDTQNALQFGSPVTVGEQAEVVLGDFQATWIARDSGKAPELVFRRSVRVGDKEFQQGFWINWPALQRTLVDPVKDIYPAAALKPVTQSLTAVPSATLGRMLASIPAELVVPAAPEVALRVWTPLRTALLATWVLVALSLVTLALAARAMAELAERRGQFVSAVTHELRTPLTTFRLYSQMLSEGMIQDEQAKRGYAQTLFSESQRLGRIVESVLDYARLGKHSRARPMELQWERRPLGELASQMDATLQGVASQHGMTLDLIPPEAGPNSSLREVRVDITRLERILVNLVENAGKYGKPIDALGEHRAVVKWSVEGSRVQISVRDFGAGISAREAKNIFRPFTRGEAHAHGSTPGMGLGLSLARGLAEQMGGSLGVQSPRDGGLGAEFIVDLPG